MTQRLQYDENPQGQKLRKNPPGGQSGEVLHTLVAKDGKLLGYSGYTLQKAGDRSSWVERRTQVRRDIHVGYRYYVTHDGVEINLRPNGHHGLAMLDPAGQDALVRLIPASNAALDTEHLMMVERYPHDLYLNMRRDS